jgi:hypothetical protein
LYIPFAKLCELYLKKPFFAGITPRMTEEDRNVAMQFVKEHFVFLKISLAFVDHYQYKHRLEKSK